MGNNHPTGNCEKKKESNIEKWADFLYGEEQEHGCNVIGIEIESDPASKGIKVTGAKRRNFKDLIGKDYISIKVKEGPVKVKKVAKQTAQEAEGMEI